MTQNLNIALFGFGTVGQGVYQVINSARNAHARITHVCVRNINKPRSIQLPAGLLTDNAEEIFKDPDVNLIVEVVDDAAASYDIVTTALRRGIPVVSGSKAMIARHLPELIKLQQECGAALLYDASACGSIPVIRNLEEYYDNDLLLEVKGILNGSSNYILSRVFDHHEAYGVALDRARRLGFAESDPTFDLSGMDSLFKLIIITVHALGVYIEPEMVFTYGITTIHDADINYAREKGVKIKLVAQVVKV
ncbi:MAG: homoserine dehydrogenase, partial [Muribaculaceae bacterium]|nr:homoserine dehydrogenase [Muribaculaceae bacterium]